MKISQKKSDAVVRGYMRFVYVQTFTERLKYCFVVMGSGKKKRSYLAAGVCGGLIFLSFAGNVFFASRYFIK